MKIKNQIINENIDRNDSELISALVDTLEMKVKHLSNKLLISANLRYINSNDYTSTRIESDLYYKTYQILKRNRKINLHLFKSDPEKFTKQVSKYLDQAFADYLKNFYRSYQDYEIKSEKEIKLDDEILNNIPDRSTREFTNRIIESERITAIVKSILSAKEKIKDPYIKMVLEFLFEGYSLEETYILLEGNYKKEELTKLKNEGFRIIRESCKSTYDSWS
jgi:hypothetical protein